MGSGSPEQYRQHPPSEQPEQDGNDNDNDNDNNNSNPTMSSQKVDLYRNELGMTPCSKTALQKGVYPKILREEHRTSILYNLVLWFVSISMIAQIVIGATLTAITATNTLRIPSTVLAALGTVLAGVLAYLRAQGLPQRLHSYRAALRRVRDYADNMELRYLHDVEPAAPQEQANVVYTMYIAARKDKDDNQPDVYQTTTERGAAQAMGLSGGVGVGGGEEEQQQQQQNMAFGALKVPSFGVARLSSEASRLEAGVVDRKKAAVRWL